MVPPGGLPGLSRYAQVPLWFLLGFSVGSPRFLPKFSQPNAREKQAETNRKAGESTRRAGGKQGETKRKARENKREASGKQARCKRKAGLAKCKRRASENQAKKGKQTNKQANKRASEKASKQSINPQFLPSAPILRKPVCNGPALPVPLPLR